MPDPRLIPAVPESTVPRYQITWKWQLLLAFIGGFALCVRIYYVTHVVVFQPANLPKAHGDSVEYYNYARNLVQHAIFSKDPPSAASPVRDSFRDPGYPTFLAAWMKFFPQWNKWYAAVLISQATLSALTVVLWLQLGRRYLSLSWLAFAGVIMALWPHSVSMSSNIMSETLYGFFVAFALVVFDIARVRNSGSWAVFSGVLFSLASLTNSVFLPFAMTLTLYVVLKRQMYFRIALIFMASTIAMLLPWNIRNVTLHTSRQSSSDRALMNFVQGSWPQYHSAVKASEILKDPRASGVIDQINNEIYTIENDRSAGLSMMAKRIALDLTGYFTWYLRKPQSLWDWSLRMGAGDIYFNVTYHSPFDSSGPWKIVAALCHASNGLFMLLALAGCVLALSAKPSVPGFEATSLLLLFVTIVHSALQAEPRYSIPYRGGEILLSVFALNWIMRNVSNQRHHQFGLHRCADTASCA
jgi:4-amino-4-deoxy-L-arabinose transferase-like glycosyltransferase